MNDIWDAYKLICGLQARMLPLMYPEEVLGYYRLRRASLYLALHYLGCKEL